LIWAWIGIILAGLLVLFIGILSIPLKVVLDYDSAADPKLRLRLDWLFGLISRDMAGLIKGRPARKRYRGPGLPNMLNLAMDADTADYWRLAKGIWHRFHIQNLFVRLRFSAGNPAVTGMLKGLVAAFTAFVSLPSRYHVTIEPSFNPEAFFAGQAQLAISLVPIGFFPPIVRFLFSRTGWRLVRRSVHRPRRPKTGLSVESPSSP
jgi:hypothetical protein